MIRELMTVMRTLRVAGVLEREWMWGVREDWRRMHKACNTARSKIWKKIDDMSKREHD